MSYQEIDAETLARHECERDRHFRFNFAVHVVEGGLFMGGLNFVAPVTVLPAMVENLGAAAWLIALAPCLFSIGALAPGVFVAPWIESLARMKPLILVMAFFQRLSYLVAGLLLVWGEPSDGLALSLVIAAPLLCGFLGGLTLPAWQEFVSRTVPANRRSSLWALRFLFHACIGVMAGIVVERVLGENPGLREYGWLHLILFAFLAGSYVVFCASREAVLPPKRAAASSRPWTLVKSIPATLRADKIFRQFLITKVAFHWVFFVIPFMGVHALQTTGRGPGFLGVLLSWQMGGMVLGNLVAGYLGDRKGGRAVLLVGHLLLLGLCLLYPWMETGTSFIAMFVLFGLGLAFTNVGGQTMDLEISPVHRRVSSFALIGWANLLGILMASVIAGQLRAAGCHIHVLAALAVSGISLAILLLWNIPEPRGRFHTT